MWAFPAEGVEFIGVLNDTVYATTDTQVIAVSAVDGTVIWRHAADDYFSDGGSIIGVAADDVWVIAPYNSNLHLDPTTGRTLAIDTAPTAELPVGFVPLVARPPTDWTVVNSFGGAHAELPDGERVWQLFVTDSGYYEGAPAIREGALTIVPATDGYVYAITLS